VCVLETKNSKILKSHDEIRNGFHTIPAMQSFVHTFPLLLPLACLPYKSNKNKLVQQMETKRMGKITKGRIVTKNKRRRPFFTVVIVV